MEVIIIRNKNLSFLDIDKLGTDIPESIKDEMRIANLHGYNLVPFVNKFKEDTERIHYIRLLVQDGHLDTKDTILTDFDSDVLRILVKYVETNTDFRIIISKYTSNNNALLIEKESFIKILLGYLKYPQIIKYNFLNIPPELVDSFIYAIRNDVDVLDLQDYSVAHNSEVVKLLINLKVADVPILGFLQGDWNSDQVYALISGSTVIKPEELIQQFDLDETFTAGSIKEVIRAYSISPELATLVATKDDDEVPIYNQYQMYEVIEGVRLGLDVSSYYHPHINDLEMRLKREKLMEREENRTGKVFRERVLSKTNIKLEDEYLNNFIN